MNSKHTTKRIPKEVFSITVDKKVKEFFGAIPKRNRSGLANEILLRYIRRQQQQTPAR